MSRMVRPDWGEFARGVTGYIACSCGSMLQNFHATREHWQAGHFDTVVPDETPSEVDARLTELERRYAVMLDVQTATAAALTEATKTLAQIVEALKLLPAVFDSWPRR